MEHDQVHDQIEMHQAHWHEQVDDWRGRHAARLGEFVRMGEQVRNLCDALNGDLYRIFGEDESILSSHVLTETPEGREVAGWLRELHGELTTIRAEREFLDERYLHAHEAAVAKLHRLVELFET